MYRLEYNSKQKSYHVSKTNEALMENWKIILDNSTRKEIDVFYKKLINQ